MRFPCWMIQIQNATKPHNVIASQPFENYPAYLPSLLSKLSRVNPPTPLPHPPPHHLLREIREWKLVFHWANYPGADRQAICYTLKELQSLIATLQFACRVVVLGFTFSQRMASLIRGISNTAWHIKLDAELGGYISMWLKFLDHWNWESALSSPEIKSSNSLMLLVPWVMPDMSLGNGKF